jgi:activator of HSP90 ATPase
MNAKSALLRPGFTRRQAIATGALAVAGAAIRPMPALAGTNEEISRTAEAIHQERVFAAGRKRVYEALTIAKQFDKIIDLGGVMKSGAMANSKAPTILSAHVGGAFSLFGGHIVGRLVELVPNELIVQAWRALNWPSATYSIARFELSDQGAATRLVFDHAGFPSGQGEHLAAGWQANYWDPLAKLLAQEAARQ